MHSLYVRVCQAVHTLPLVFINSVQECCIVKQSGFDCYLHLTYLLVHRKYREEADRRVRELDQDFEQAIQETETRVRSKVSNQITMATGQGDLNLTSSFNWLGYLRIYKV